MDTPSFTLGCFVGFLLSTWISMLILNLIQRQSTKMWRDTIEKISNNWYETCRDIRGK